jgi:hypothetical protein
MDICVFERKLEEIIGRPTDLRPFVCDGSPLDCEVFIVGFNATTDLDFWNFWERHVGYNKTRWEQAYCQERVSKGKRELSNTRTMIGWILENLSVSAKVLETNVNAKASSRVADLSQDEHDTSTFQFLLRSIHPKVIVAHGDDAQEAVKSLLGSDFTGTLITTKHLRFWSRTRAGDLAKQIKRSLHVSR